MNNEKDFQLYYESHDDNDYVMIGQIELFDDHDAMVEKVIGDLDLKGKIKSVTVELFLREGWTKPHFHVYNDHFSTAIRLDTNEYFIHGKYKDKLNDRQAKILDEFLRGFDKGIDISRWTLAKYDFNREFPGHIITTKHQPDYTMLNYK